MKKILIKINHFFYYTFLMQLIIGLTNFFPNHSIFNRVRGFLLKPFFKKCGSNFRIAKGAIINMSRNMIIGDNVYLAHDIWINATGGLTIDDSVVVSPKVVIATTKHVYENNKISSTESINGPIHIGKGTWISSHCTIIMKVNIGKGCIIGANSVVTKDVPDYTFSGGVPSKIINNLN